MRTIGKKCKAEGVADTDPAFLLAWVLAAVPLGELEPAFSSQKRSNTSLDGPRASRSAEPK